MIIVIIELALIILLLINILDLIGTIVSQLNLETKYVDRIIKKKLEEENKE